MDPVPVLGVIIAIGVIAGLVHRTISSRLAQSMPGGMPADPGAPLGMPGASQIQAAPAGGSGEDVKERILATGTEGHAKILQATPTGETDAEGKQIFDLLFEVSIEGFPAFQAPSRAAVPPEKTPRMVAGTTLAVKADPANPNVMAVDWENTE